MDLTSTRFFRRKVSDEIDTNISYDTLHVHRCYMAFEDILSYLSREQQNTAEALSQQHEFHHTLKEEINMLTHQLHVQSQLSEERGSKLQIMISENKLLKSQLQTTLNALHISSLVQNSSNLAHENSTSRSLNPVHPILLSAIKGKANLEYETLKLENEKNCITDQLLLVQKELQSVKNRMMISQQQSDSLNKRLSEEIAHLEEELKQARLQEANSSERCNRLLRVVRPLFDLSQTMTQTMFPSSPERS
ncbi:hypothetical protein BLNAU_20042 [Blattamonas nauphoetae]|uniref:Uncharacterized protein n=1 Tax=Blattamonas nauphoetae TaxID=2049346 RepID=A0ABQ9WZU0_9EUKA|nr:hypothetical protein BLNAU_20042 [Blattamonas nauphoetae]